MSSHGPHLVIQEIPQPVRAQAEKLGIRNEDVLFAALSDLTLSARPHDVWLVVTQTQAVAIEVNGQSEDSVLGPYLLAGVTKARSFQTVGSSFLQFQMDGAYRDILRYSNAYREQFGRVRTQIDRILSNEPVELEALRQSSEHICEVCGLPLPGRGHELPALQRAPRSFSSARPCSCGLTESISCSSWP